MQTNGTVMKLRMDGRWRYFRQSWGWAITRDRALGREVSDQASKSYELRFSYILCQYTDHGKRTNPHPDKTPLDETQWVLSNGVLSWIP